MIPTMPPATEAKVVVTADLKYENYNVSCPKDWYLNVSESLVKTFYLAASFHFRPDIPNVLPQLNPSHPHLQKITFIH